MVEPVELFTSWNELNGLSPSNYLIWALVEQAWSDRPGDRRVSIVRSRESDGWEMKGLRTSKGYTQMISPSIST